MSDSNSLPSNYLKKCPFCKKLIESQKYQSHIAECPYQRQHVQDNKKDHPPAMIPCRKCNHRLLDFRLYFHLEGSPRCRKSYSKSDFVTIFELWARFNSESPSFHMDVKIAYKQMKKTEFIEASTDSFCNGCGESFERNTFKDHLQSSPECKSAFKDLSGITCTCCTHMYSRLLLHLQESQKCMLSILHPTEEPSNNNKSSTARSPTFEEQINSVSEEEVHCKGCGSTRKRNSILKHFVKKPGCKESYSEQELHQLYMCCKSSKDNKRRLWNRRRTGIIPNESKEKTYLEILKENEKPKSIIKIRKTLRPKNPPEDKVMTCKKCKKSLKINRILKHIVKSKHCMSKYSSKELEDLKLECKQHSKTMKLHKQNQAGFEKRYTNYLHNKYMTKKHTYESLKRKIKEWHVKCILAIDLNKLFHYMWEVQKVVNGRRRQFPTLNSNDNGKLRGISLALEQKVIEIQDHIESCIKEVKNTTTKWCFDDKVQNTRQLQLDDMKIINSKCQELFNHVIDQFNNQLTSTFNELHSFCTEIKYNGKVNPFKFKHQYKWEYEKSWDKFEDTNHVDPDEKEHYAIYKFVSSEITKIVDK